MEKLVWKKLVYHLYVMDNFKENIAYKMVYLSYLLKWLIYNR